MPGFSGPFSRWFDCKLGRQAILRKHALRVKVPAWLVPATRHPGAEHSVTDALVRDRGGISFQKLVEPLRVHGGQLQRRRDLPHLQEGLEAARYLGYCSCPIYIVRGDLR